MEGKWKLLERVYGIIGRIDGHTDDLLPFERGLKKGLTVYARRWVLFALVALVSGLPLLVSLWIGPIVTMVILLIIFITSGVVLRKRGYL